MATDFNYANTITAATPAVAAEVQDNFDDVLTWVKAYYQQTLDTTTEITSTITASALLLDGSSAMTGDLDLGGNSIVNGTTATAWTAVTYANSWVDYGGGYQTVQYRLNGDNVEIRGSMKDGSNVANCFTLPSGFRSPANSIFMIGGGGAQYAGLLSISTAGVAFINLTTPGTSVSLVQLNISFSVTA